MDPDLENVIRQGLADAQAAGRDYLSQTEHAVQAVLTGPPGHDRFRRAGSGQLGAAVVE